VRTGAGLALRHGDVMVSTMSESLLDATPDAAPAAAVPPVARRSRKRPAGRVRHDWSLDEIRGIHDLPLLDLVHRAATVHRRFHDASEVQVCRLISIKTGGCPEDCSYCSQSAHYETGIAAQPMLDRETVLGIARKAREHGISRVCMGAAWREARDNDQFEHVLDLVKSVTALGLEVCCTLGMLTESQAVRLEAAGLYAYNHNLDTSARFYETIITTRKYEDRLNTLAEVRKTRITVCCGGILGLGEDIEDRLALLATLAGLKPHPESVPINLLAKVPGTPMAGQPDVPFDQVVRMVATARILMPRSVVRLSAGRAGLSASEQALCFLAGANSVFSSETRSMLTSAVPSPDYEADGQLLGQLGLRMKEPFSDRGSNGDRVVS
jgi:biotin synthase